MKKTYQLIIIAIVALVLLFSILKEARGQLPSSPEISYDEETYKFEKVYFKFYLSKKNDSIVMDSLKIETGAFNKDSFNIKDSLLYFRNKLVTGKDTLPEKCTLYCKNQERYLLINEENVFYFNLNKKHWKIMNLDMRDFYCVLNRTP